MIQRAARDVRITAKKAYVLEVILVGIAAIAIAAAAILGAWNTVRLREVSEDARVAAEAAKVQSEFNERLSKVVAEYNTAHAESTAESHAALAEALLCGLKLFLSPPQLPAPEEVDACYRPTQPAPPVPVVPEGPNQKDPEKK